MRSRRLLAPILAVGLVSAAGDANVGGLVLRDEAQILTPADAAQLKAVVAQAPFDARLVTTTNYADEAGFSRFVGTLVSEPNMVVVGIDPQHHHVEVHFGTASPIPEADRPAIERAGDDAFERRAWEEGGVDIFRAATTAVSHRGRSATPVALVILLAVGVLLAAVLFAVLRRRSAGHEAV
jgi:hypothetical protein